MRVPIRVAWYHTVSEQIAQDSPQPKWKQGLLQLRKGLAYGAATRLVANSGASAADAQKVYSLPKFKCAVFHNAIRDPLFELRLPADFVRVETARLVCVGRFFPSKGQDVLLRALAILKKQIPPVHVEFIGTGPRRKSLEERAQKLGVEGNCTFLDQLPHDEVLRKMAGAVCTVVPSRHEAFGLVNIESMAMGTPVVASAVGGIVEIIRDGKDGFLVPPNEPEKLAEKLLALVSNPRLRSELGCNARQRFLSHFELRGAISEQADWFESIADVSFVRRRNPASGTAHAISQRA
jgi:glycosyltransferase involved in cell wall biosynthesis